MAALSDLLASQNVYLVLLSGAIIYYAAVGVYRLYFSPLARFPGPKLAALTYWFQFYHDVIRQGQYIFETKKMHEKYGKQSRSWMATKSR